MHTVFSRLRDSAALLKKPRTLALTGLFVAMSVGLDLLRVQLTQDLRLSLGFVAIAMAAMLFGAAAAMPAAAAADVVALMLNPSGAYFPGFTLTAVVGAAIYSAVLFERAPGKRGGVPLWRAFLARGLVNLICNIGLNTLWLSMLYGHSVAALLPARALKNLVMLVPEALILYAVALAVQGAQKAMSRR